VNEPAKQASKTIYLFLGRFMETACQTGKWFLSNPV
jgi:hypothetical protein